MFMRTSVKRDCELASEYYPVEILNYCLCPAVVWDSVELQTRHVAPCLARGAGRPGAPWARP